MPTRRMKQVIRQLQSIESKKRWKKHSVLNWVFTTQLFQDGFFTFRFHKAAPASESESELWGKWVAYRIWVQTWKSLLQICSGIYAILLADILVFRTFVKISLSYRLWHFMLYDVVWNFWVPFRICVLCCDRLMLRRGFALCSHKNFWHRSTTCAPKRWNRCK